MQITLFHGDSLAKRLNAEGGRGGAQFGFRDLISGGTTSNL